MKGTFRNLTALAAMGLIVGASGSAVAADATGNASVAIQNQAITLIPIVGQDLNFGTVLPFGRTGHVTVWENGTHQASNAHIADTNGISTSGFTVSGVNSAPYAISLPASNTVTLTSNVDPADTMTITGFIRTGYTDQRVLDANGDGTFSVGATLNVGSNQPAGTYSGTYTVTVSYN